MKIDKSKNFSEWYNEVIKQAGLCDLRYNIKGFIVIMPWAMKSIDQIYRIYDRELEKTGHSPAFFPSLIHEKSFDAEGEHVKGFKPEVLWVTEAGDKKLEERYALKPTGEACMYPMYSLWINGLSDLPLKIYQKGWVWRHETKATKPFIRGREFLWIEAHDVFADENGSKEQTVEDYGMTREVIWEELGIPYMAFRRPQWDKFAGARDTFAADTLMPDGRVLQIASTHLLGQNFSKAYNVRYMDQKGETQYAWQTCYGPGISRIYIATVCVHGDDKGMVLPFAIAPVQVVIVPIMRKGNEEKVASSARKIADGIRKAGLKVEVDMRDQSPGFKFNYWEQKGVPLRIEIGEREIASGSVVVATRDNGKKENVKLGEIEKEIVKMGNALTARLKEKGAANFENALDSAKDIGDMVKKIEAGKIVRVAFCTDQMEGENCAKALKEKHACDVRGSVFSTYLSEKPGFSGEPIKNEKCIACGKKASVWVYVARQY